jgi:SynChlorMet cassette protein ScmD
MMLKIAHEVASWHQAWSSSESSPPALHLHRLSNETFLLCDSRGLPGTWKVQFLDRELAAAVLVSRRFAKTAEIEWAVNQKVGIELDGRYVPLATAEPALLQEFETGLCEVDQVAAQPLTDLHTSSGRKGVNKVVPGNKPIANPLVVFREEFDDWAILFDPDSGDSFGLDPVSAFIWKHLDSRHTIQDIVAELHEICEGMPKDAEERINDFIQDLIEKGLAGYKLQKV